MTITQQRKERYEADMGANKKLKSIAPKLFMRGKKTQHLSCFYIKVVFRSA